MKSIIHSDPDILAGEPVLVGTRVPAKTQTDPIAAGVSVGTLLEDFRPVRREQVVAFLE